MRIGRLFCGFAWSSDPWGSCWWYDSDIGDRHTSYLSVKKLRRPSMNVSFLIFEIGPIYLAFALYPRKQQP